MTNETTLLSDQVFQLNAFLWALEDLPAPGKIQPVLRNTGYYLAANGHQSGSDRSRSSAMTSAADRILPASTSRFPSARILSKASVSCICS